ncbi:hypothetical protein PR048_015885 [Dryococelus australis]|uniref:DUF4371 domain-containing protein n=1 Tax=Dryococelus australis TaxID=614101 RepID=A0ABQ9HI82_9NEOP|nr:hypothetical protein PR048_015885 [Dryococelus australis]
MASGTVGVGIVLLRNGKMNWIPGIQNAQNVTSVYCKLCRKSETSLRELRNFNTAFIEGIKDSAIKKDNCVKHAKSKIHILNKPASIQEFFVKTYVGKAMPSISGETKQCIGKLVDIAYALTQEEIAFNKFQKLVELEKRHGVDIGETYTTVPKREEFTSCIVTTLKNELINLRSTDYLRICCDGTTDDVTDKDIVFVMFINNDTSAVEFKYLKITDLSNSSSSAIFNSLKEMLTKFGVKFMSSIQKSLVTFISLGEENVTSIPTNRVQGVRWVSHKKNYNVIVSQLENLATGNKSQAAKLSGIEKTMKSAKFVAWVLFLKTFCTIGQNSHWHFSLTISTCCML